MVEPRTTVSKERKPCTITPFSVALLENGKPGELGTIDILRTSFALQEATQSPDHRKGGSFRQSDNLASKRKQNETPLLLHR